MTIQSINPYNLQSIEEYALHTDQQINDKIEQTQGAWLKWRNSGYAERSYLLNKLAEIIRARKVELARLMALEMGKPVKQGISEADKCAAVCEYYAEKAAGFLSDQIIKTEAIKSYVCFNPLGVVLAVMPWNFPLWQVFRFLAPALAAGNCGVLKHASNVPGCALAIEDMVTEAGFPPYVFQTLLAGSNKVDKIIEHEHIKAVTLTGSTQAGIKVAQKAGSLLKKTVLELGGSDAYIVLEDADIALAAKVCAESRLINGGQSCIAAKRFIVVKEVEEEFTRLFTQYMSQKVMGDPLEDRTDLGPMARADLRDELHSQVIKSVTQGARCILGGKIPDGENAFYPPTVLVNVTEDNLAFNEELFGPVAAIISANEEEDAISLANKSQFGLGAAVFTNDVERGDYIAANLLEAGSCFVNGLVKSDPRLPFGGIKQSGYGRELGMFGIHEFVNIKTVVIA